MLQGMNGFAVVAGKNRIEHFTEFVICKLSGHDEANVNHNKESLQDAQKSGSCWEYLKTRQAGGVRAEENTRKKVLQIF